MLIRTGESSWTSHTPKDSPLTPDQAAAQSEKLYKEENEQVRDHEAMDSAAKYAAKRVINHEKYGDTENSTTVEAKTDLGNFAGQAYVMQQKLDAKRNEGGNLANDNSGSLRDAAIEMIDDSKQLQAKGFNIPELNDEKIAK